MTIQYRDHPKSYLLTPSRKKVGKLVARGSKITIADQFFKDLQLRKHMVAKIGRLVQDEISGMCSNKYCSVLQNHSVHSFSCEGIVAEMEGCGTNRCMALLPDPFSILPKGVWARDYMKKALMADLHDKIT